MYVTLAVPWDGHAPNDTIAVSDEVGRQLIRDGWARRGLAPSQRPPEPVPEPAIEPEPVAAPLKTRTKKTAQPTEDSPTTGTTQEQE